MDALKLFSQAVGEKDTFKPLRIPESAKNRDEIAIAFLTLIKASLLTDPENVALKRHHGHLTLSYIDHIPRKRDRQSELREATNNLLAALEAWPEELTIQEDLATCYYLQEDYEQALPFLENILESYPKDEFIRFQVAYSHFKINDLEATRRTLETYSHQELTELANTYALNDELTEMLIALSQLESKPEPSP